MDVFQLRFVVYDAGDDTNSTTDAIGKSEVTLQDLIDYSERLPSVAFEMKLDGEGGLVEVMPFWDAADY